MKEQPMKTYKFNELSDEIKDYVLDRYLDVNYEYIQDELQCFYRELEETLENKCVSIFTQIPNYLANYIQNSVIYNIKIKDIDIFTKLCKTTFYIDTYKLYLDLLYHRNLPKPVTNSTKQRLAYVLGYRAYIEYTAGKKLHKELFNETWEATYNNIKTDLENAILSVCIEQEKLLRNYMLDQLYSDDYDFTEDGEIL